MIIRYAAPLQKLSCSTSEFGAVESLDAADSLFVPSFQLRAQPPG